MFIIKSILNRKEVLQKMKINPPENTDIVKYAQNIIDNYVSDNARRIKYINPRAKRKKNRVDAVLWTAAGIMCALTLFLYIAVRYAV